MDDMGFLFRHALISICLPMSGDPLGSNHFDARGDCRFGETKLVFGRRYNVLGFSEQTGELKLAKAKQVGGFERLLHPLTR